MKEISCDFLIIGGGMVGLCIAHQLLKYKPKSKIKIIDKARSLGLHSSGRNSGVLHAGLYYQPDSLKAKVCVSGAKLLKEWITERNLPLNQCGKIIVPQREDLDSQLDLLAERGIKNRAHVEIWNERQLHEAMPEARSASGRAIWSPNTVVTKPLKVVERLAEELKEKGVIISLNEDKWEAFPEMQKIKTSNENIRYGHMFNCAGLNSDIVAHQYGVGKNYTLLPFKGIYWQLKMNCNIHIPCNLYPVPDLSVPFLGVHFTPSTDKIPIVSIGPTATPALGRENYRGFEGFDPAMTAKNLGLLAKLYLTNRGGFRQYVHEQAFLSLPPLLLKAAQELIPSIKATDIEPSKKVGIRSQLFNLDTSLLENDFVCLSGENSTHVLNAISPAFTASFALADLIIDRSGLKSP